MNFQQAVEDLADRVAEVVEGEDVAVANMALVDVLFGDIESREELEFLMDTIIEIANAYDFDEVTLQ